MIDIKDDDAHATIATYKLTAVTGGQDFTRAETLKGQFPDNQLSGRDLNTIQNLHNAYRVPHREVDTSRNWKSPWDRVREHRQ
jgi:hypothetical protein